LLQRVWRYYPNSAIPLGLKWSLSIAALIVLAMGGLGFFLIQEQETAYRSQVDRFSRVIVEQLARVSGEPMMARDTLALQLLAQRHAQSDLVLGAVLHDADGRQLAVAGITPPGDYRQQVASSAGPWDWDSSGFVATSYVSPVVYQDVAAGYALVSIDRLPLEKDLQRTLAYLVASTLLLMLVGILMASLLAHRMSRPISRLARAGQTFETASLETDGQRRDEIGKVLATFNHLVDDAKRSQKVETAFSRYVSPQVAHQVLDSEIDSALGGHSVTGSVLFCDIVGFTKLSETRDPAEVAALLNSYFGFFALAAESCGGTVDKFIGDAIMIVFGAPRHDPHHALHAMTCGMLIQHLTKRLNAIRTATGEETVTLRVGISSGPMLAGNLGSVNRMQYTVIGDTVNVAARLCALADAGGVMLTAAMREAGQPGDSRHYRDLGPVNLKGRQSDVEISAMDVDAVAADVDADTLVERILTGGEA
jgi:adenylate cyclase